MGHMQRTGYLTVDCSRRNLCFLPQLLGVLRRTCNPALEAKRFTILQKCQLCHFMSQIIDIFSFGLNAPLFCDADELLGIFYFISSIGSGCIQGMADLTAMIGVSRCAACSKFQIITSYDTMSITAADSSRSLRSDTARSHSTDTAADTLLTEFTMRCLVLYAELPGISANLSACFQQSVSSGFELFNCC